MPLMEQGQGLLQTISYPGKPRVIFPISLFTCSQPYSVLDSLRPSLWRHGDVTHYTSFQAPEECCELYNKA
jgi:hypothetical protein